jgi:hypothetical protein
MKIWTDQPRPRYTEAYPALHPEGHASMALLITACVSSFHGGGKAGERAEDSFDISPALC